MNTKINENVIKYIDEHHEKYEGLNIKQDELWHLHKIIISSKTTIKEEKTTFHLQKDGVSIQVPMSLFKLPDDIISE